MALRSTAVLGLLSGCSWEVREAVSEAWPCLPPTVGAAQGARTFHHPPQHLPPLLQPLPKPTWEFCSPQEELSLSLCHRPAGPVSTPSPVTIMPAGTGRGELAGARSRGVGCGSQSWLPHRSGPAATSSARGGGGERSTFSPGRAKWLWPPDTRVHPRNLTPWLPAPAGSGTCGLPPRPSCELDVLLLRG